MHTHTHIHTRAYTYANTVRTYTHTHLHTHTSAHAHTYTTHPHTCTHTHTHTQAACSVTSMVWPCVKGTRRAGTVCMCGMCTCTCLFMHVNPWLGQCPRYLSTHPYFIHMQCRAPPLRTHTLMITAQTFECGHNRTKMLTLILNLT